jgi:LacI family transcriptional regulator
MGAAMAVTLSDIAERIGVSKMTVSLVLNNRKSGLRISDRTRERILATAQELNYIPSFSARSLARGKTFSIGFLCGDIQSPHYSELATMAMREAEARGYHLLVSVTPWISTENNLECLETILSRGVDGLIHFGNVPVDSKVHRRIMGEQFPIVTVNELTDGLSGVVSDWESGMDEAVRHLKGKGHGRIGYVRSAYVDKTTDPKYLAFHRACRQHGVETMDYASVGHPPTAREDGRRIARDPKRPRALIIASDYTATGILRGLRIEGLEVPRDVAVIGIDGTDMGEFMNPPLTSIAQDRDGIVKTAMDMVVKMIDKEESPGRKVRLPTKLISREST